MKRNILLLLALTVMASVSFAQAPRRVLLEEFTNTGCPPCAATDPFMEVFQEENMDKLCVLKYHTQGPDPSDPFYIADPADGNPRANYYSVPGVPTMQFDGVDAITVPSGVPALESSLDDSYGSLETSPFELSVSQEIVGDSIIATITLKAVGAVPAGDLRLGVVVAERYQKYLGNNGRPYSDFIVRSMVSGINTDGSIKVNTKYPAITIANGETKTYRYAAKIIKEWVRPQLMTVSFVQENDSKQVYQSNWTIPSLTVQQPASSFILIPSDKDLTYKINNPSTTPYTLNAKYIATGVPADWNINVNGIDNGTVTVPAMGSATVTINSTAASNKYGYKPFTLSFTTPEGLYISDVTGQGWGKDNQHVVVDAGAGTTKSNAVATAIGSINNDYTTHLAVIPRADFETAFADWSSFKTVIYNAGTTTGLYSDVGSWEKLSQFLSNGGHFLLSSTVTVAAYYNGYVQGGGEGLMDYFRDNFHIEPTTWDNATAWGELIGVDNDALGNGIDASVTGLTTTQDLQSADAEAIPCFRNENANVVGTRYENAAHGKSVLLTFGLDAVKTSDRPLVTKKVMDWFAGVASVKTSNNASSFIASNYPNPARSNTTITYSLTERAPVSLVVRDVMGREVAHVVSNETQDAGTYEADVDVSKFSNGTYFYTLTAGEKSLTQTLNVVK